MAKTKKSFDKELMYKKIMPTNLKKSTNQDTDDLTVEHITKIKQKDINVENDISIFKNKEIYVKKDEKKDIILFNVMEKLVINKLDATLRKMNCCRCDRCKEDIVALALNNLKPMYVVNSKDEINHKIKELDQNGIEVTTAVLKAVLIVRKNPRH